MIQTERLKNRITIITEQVENVRSVAVGIWVKVGSLNESPSNNGISHFLEHMMFKGTAKRNAQQIAIDMDSIGGEIGAFTSREMTCYYAKSLDERFTETLEILSDIFLNSLFDPVELEREKSVICEEIKMYEDTPDEIIHDLFIQTIWKDHALGQPIIGNAEIIASLNRDNLVNYHKTHYVSEKIIIAVAGNITHVDVKEKVEYFFGQSAGRKVSQPHIITKIPKPQIKHSLQTFHKDTEQLHLCLGTKGLSVIDDERYVFSLMNTILGGSMSSRLFQEIREKRGLAYAVGSYQNSFALDGLLVIYVGTSPQNYKEVVQIILDEFRNLKNICIPRDELEKAKTQIKGNLLLSLEETKNRMTRIAKQQFYFNRIFSIEEIIEEIEKVDIESVKILAEKLFQPTNLAITTIGPLDQKDIESVGMEI